MSTLTTHTTASRAAHSVGLCKFNTTSNAIEVSDGTDWLIYDFDTTTAFANRFSLTLDGTGDRLDTSSVVTPSATSGTISAWIKTTSTAYQAVLSTADTSGNVTWGWMAVYNNKLRITFRASGGTVKTADGSTTINDGNWHHVVAVSSGTAYSLYVDGSAETLTNSNNDGTWFGDLTSLTSTNIGSHVRSAAGNYFLGNIDDVAVWDSDQSSNISTIYNSGKPSDLSTFSPSPALWYRMGDGSEGGTGTTIYDASNSNNGTLSGDAAIASINSGESIYV